ncbi:MAG: phosphate propanoyltransferase [Clostridia bacterium]|nr:phosphate propanoyltransferase [Clostridia bacterium]MBR3691157.1 phosphate propanoyltransferase [Clostridia bacterium]
MEKLNVIIEASARHIHLSEADLAVLFGEGAKLTPKRELSQPGQYLSEERVSIVGPKGTISNLGVLGPTRPATQVEVSFTDARALGIVPPIRESGDVAGTPGCKVVGPCGEVEIKEGVMVAKRHIHITPEDAEKYGLKDKQIVSVKVGGDRGITFGETVVRVSPKFRTRMHVDFDESNAAALAGEMTGEVIAE